MANQTDIVFDTNKGEISAVEDLLTGNGYAYELEESRQAGVVTIHVLKIDVLEGGLPSILDDALRAQIWKAEGVYNIQDFI